MPALALRSGSSEGTHLVQPPPQYNTYVLNRHL